MNFPFTKETSIFQFGVKKLTTFLGRRLAKSFLLLLLVISFMPKVFSLEPATKPIEVKMGCYLENFRNFDYVNGTFRADVYFWVDSPAKYPEPLEHLDFPRARPIWSSPLVKWEKDGRYYETANYVVEVNHNWDITKFPFDTQRLRIKVEDLNDSVTDLVFNVDKESNFAENFISPEWKILSKKIYVTTEEYKTNFGDVRDGHASSEYSRFIIEVILSRHALSLFFKLVAGAYAAFAAICFTFWLRSDVPAYLGARFTILMGCIFGTIINQRVVESVVGRSSYVTHIDIIHFLTLISCILAGVIALISMHLSSKDRVKQSLALDRIAFWIILILYLSFNIILVGYDYWGIASITE